MALDKNELQQIAALLGEALAPKIRESIAEQVTVRMDAALLNLREYSEAAAKHMQEVVDQRLADVNERIGQLDARLGTQRQAVEGVLTQFAQSEATVKDVLGQLTEAAKVSLDTTNGISKSLDWTQNRIDDVSKRVEAVKEAIPTIPEIPQPVALLEGGELSPQMRAAMEVATKEVFGPMIEGVVQGAKEAADQAAERALEATANVNMSLSKSIADGYTKFREEIDTVVKTFTEFEAKVPQDIDKATAAIAKVVDENNTTTDKALDELAKRIVEVNDSASKSCNLLNATVQELTQATHALAQATTDKATELDSKLETNVRAVLETVEKNISDTLKRIDEVGNNAGEGLKSVGEAFQVLQKDVLAPLQEKVDQHATDIEACKATDENLVKYTDAKCDSLRTKLSGEVAEAAERIAGATAENVKTAMTQMHVQAREVGAEAGAAAGVESVKPGIAEIQQRAERAIGEVVDKAAEVAAETATKSVAAALPDMLDQAKTAAREVADTVARVAAEAKTVHFLGEAEKVLREVGAEVGAEAGAAATLKALPDMLEQARAVAAEAAVPAARETADIIAQDAVKTARLVARTASHDLLGEREASLMERVADTAAKSTLAALPEILIHARSAAAEAGGRAADSVAKDAIAAARPELVEAAQAAAQATATQVATDLGKATLVAASTEAQAAARVAADALRAGLLEALNPAPLVERAVAEAVPAAAKSSVKEAVDEMRARVMLDLVERLDSEVKKLPPPKDGKDGKIELPVAYEEGKSYELGTWVTHDSGVWVADRRKTTHAPSPDNADWFCILPGVKSIEAVLQQDGRTVEFLSSLANGTEKKSSFRLAVPISKGVYKEGVEYVANDLCTYDGSWWEAQTAGKLARPGTDKSWRLSIKRGQNGVDRKPLPPEVIRYAHNKADGEWQMGVEYPVNAVVLHAGVHWLAMRSTRERPPFATLVSDDNWLKMGS